MLVLVTAAWSVLAGCGDDPSTTSTDVTTTTPAPASGARRVVEDGLSAWSAFTGDGNVDRLKPYFAEEGPQYVRLAEEAPGIAAAPSPTRFTLAKVASEDSPPDGPMVITAEVRIERAGAAARTATWQFTVFRQADGARIFLVQENGGRGPVPARGGI